MTVTINGTTGIAGTNGSAGTPAVQGEDTNTGIFFPAADTVAVATAGAERVRVTSVGRVGVGTNSPNQLVHVSGGNIRVSSASENTIITNGGNFTTGAVTDSAILYGSGSLLFGNGSTERARIDASGNLLVGTTSGSGGNERLNIASNNNNYVIRVSNANADPYGLDIYHSGASPNGTANGFIQCRDTTIVRMTVRSNGGIANYSANNVNLSDERVKTDVAPLGSYWDKIKALQVVTYKYLDQTHPDDNIGVIAQQVESVAPEFVSNDGFGETPEDGLPLKSIYEADLHYATLKALQEAMARIETLEAKVNALEAK